MKLRKIEKLASEIRQLLADIPSATVGLKPRQARVLRHELEQVAGELRQTLTGLDPTRQPESFFDPSDPRLFGLFAAIALIGQERIPLSSVQLEKFYGSGVYALYYKGVFPPYLPIANSEHPIYVGKADPAQQFAKTPQHQGERLCARLNDHRKNIQKAATTIALFDFECRYLVVQSGFQEAAESALIGLFNPIWNSETGILYGFGKHGDSADKRSNDRSPWDTLHPGRKWAANSKLLDARTKTAIEADLIAHFKKYPAVPNLEHVLHTFVGQIKKKAS